MTDTQVPKGEDGFAFGKDSHSLGCCPAITAGASRQGLHLNWPTEVVDIYDRYARDLTDREIGVLPEEMARTCWLNAIEYVEHVIGKPGDATLGRDVARELGWLDGE